MHVVNHRQTYQFDRLSDTAQRLARHGKPATPSLMILASPSGLALIVVSLQEPTL
jgi:hypothetical protein